jgi:hypothetical protein
VIPVPPKFRALLVRTTIAAAAVALCAAALPSAAQAGTYRIYNCQPGGVSIAAPTFAPWHIYDGGGDNEALPSRVQPDGSCGLGFPGSGTAHPMQRVSGAGFEIGPRAGFLIARVVTTIVADLKTSPPACAPPNGLCGPQQVAPINLGPGAAASAAGGNAATDANLEAAFATPVSSYRLGIRCGDGAAGADCVLVNSPALTLIGAETDVVESGPPAGKIDGGSLASVGTKAGAATLTYSASDALSGVQRVEVRLDNVVAGAADFSRNLALPVAQQGNGTCTYTDFVACPATATGDITVDTTKVPDGSHTVTLRIIDAAGNIKDVAGTPITTANAVVVGAPNGNGASRAGKLTANFTTTKKRSRHLAFDARPTIKGTLVDESGQPISGATVVIRVRPKQAGAIASQVATVLTSADGGYSFKIPGGPSRTIIVEYTAFGGDPAPATATLRAVVRAIVSSHIKPRSVRAGQKLTLSGRLRLLPRKGVEVKIQARDGRKWRTVDDVRTTATGSYHWDYHFKASARGHTFAFRARVSSPVYPFAVGNSKATLVRVR